MKNYIFASIFLLGLLTGCSSDVSEENKKAGKEISEEIDEAISEEANLNVSEDRDIESDDSNSSTEDQTKKENIVSDEVEVVDNSQEEAEIENYYEYYHNKDLKVQSTDTTVTENGSKEIVAQRINERIIELPTLENNKDVIENAIEKVSIEDLNEKGIMEYMEEPVSKGLLITVDLAAIQKLFPAKSYSLLYEDEEYGVIVSNSNENRGIILIRDSELSKEDIQQNAVIYLIN